MAKGRNVAPESGATSFVAATAAAVGKGASTVRLDAERGHKINGKALDMVQGTTLDKGAYLDQLKTVPLEKQCETVARDLEPIEEPQLAAKHVGRPPNRFRIGTDHPIWA